MNTSQKLKSNIITIMHHYHVNIFFLHEFALILCWFCLLTNVNYFLFNVGYDNVFSLDVICYVNERVTPTTGQKSVCGLRYHRSRVLPKNSNLFEKKLTERTVKLSNCNGFSPFFLHCCSVLISLIGWWWK